MGLTGNESCLSGPAKEHQTELQYYQNQSERIEMEHVKKRTEVTDMRNRYVFLHNKASDAVQNANREGLIVPELLVVEFKGNAFDFNNEKT